MADPFSILASMYIGIQSSAVEGMIADIEGAITAVEGAIADVYTVAEFTLSLYVFYEVLAHLQTFGEGVVDLVEGTGKEFVGFFEGGGMALRDIITFIITSVFYVSELIICTVKTLQNFPTCFFWYVIQIFGIILYLPFRFLFWLLGLGRVEDIIWSKLYDLDKQFYNATGGHKSNDQCSGYHFLHYPCWIVDACYRCRNDEGKPMADMKKYYDSNEQFLKDLGIVSTKHGNVNDVQGGRLKTLLIDPLSQMATGLSKMFSIFT